jgi:DNA-binding transcriptional LysR family regulator
MKPTTRAEELWPAVRQALAMLESAIAPENFDVSETHAVFRLAMADSTASLLLPGLIRAIREEAPGLDIRMLPLTTRDPRTMLLQSEIDIAVGNFPGVAAQLSGGQGTVSAIRHQRLYSSESVCIMRKGHPLADQELTLDAYCSAHHALVSFSGRAHGPADEALTALGRQRRVGLTVNQFYTVGRVVAGTDLISVVPRHLVASTGVLESLVTKELPFKLPVVNVDMLWHERDTRNPSHKWVRAQFAKLNYSQGEHFT